MMALVWMLLTFLAAGAGGLMGLKLRLPGGMLVGAILATIAFSLVTGHATMVLQTRVLAQSLTGAYIGLMVTREDLKLLRLVVRPYLVCMACFLALNVIMAFVFYGVTDLDLLTCLFCAAPGGMSDIPLIAMDMGADAPVVATMQFVRLVFGLLCLPGIIMLVNRRKVSESVEQSQAISELDSDDGTSTASKSASGKKAKLGSFLPTLGGALLAGILGKLSGIPAGTLSAALICVAALNLAGKTRPMPGWLRRVAQAIAGCCIGVGIGPTQLAGMGQMLVPVALLVTGYVLLCIGAGYLLHKMFHMDLKEGMLSMSPAGASDMALIASDMGVDSTNLVVMQICRLLGVTVVFPHIFVFIVGLFG